MHYSYTRVVVVALSQSRHLWIAFGKSTTLTRYGVKMAGMPGNITVLHTRQLCSGSTVPQSPRFPAEKQDGYQTKHFHALSFCQTGKSFDKGIASGYILPGVHHVLPITKHSPSTAYPRMSSELIIASFLMAGFTADDFHDENDNHIFTALSYLF